MATKTGIERLNVLRGGAVVRDPGEDHRVSSPLELFFDLCFVVAVAQVSTGLHETLAEHRLHDALLAYITVFAAVWWAWMNFTWFANVHDADDIPYRMLTLAQITGALVMAIGVPAVFSHNDFGTITIGYVIMRFAQVTQWLRVARGFEAMRRRATRYAIGYGSLQVLWVVRLWFPDRVGLMSYVVAMILELFVPVWAESAFHDSALVHNEHITDRYSLFTLIVLGEAVSAATIGVQQAITAGVTADIIAIGVSALLIVFVCWWLYFGNPNRKGPETARKLFEWGYGHYFVFASLGAMGAGLELAAQYVTSRREHAPVESAEVAEIAHISTRVAALAVAIPVAGFLGATMLIAVIGGNFRREKVILISSSIVVILITGLVAPVVATVVIIAVVLVTLITLFITMNPARLAEAAAATAEADPE